jgi:phosphonate transport system substrate-binding protein
MGWLRGSVVAGAVVALSVPAWAQPNVMEVKPGDTFSSIANTMSGGQLPWTALYDRRLGGLKNPNRIEPGMRFELVQRPGGKRYLRLIKGEATLAATAPATPAVPPPRAPVASPPAAEAGAPAVAQPQADTLVVGILPFIGANALMGQYEGMKAYLERLGPQKVRIVLPASFKAFYDGLMSGAFDMAVSAPHFARVAQIDGRMQPMVMYEPRINAQFVAPSDSNLMLPRDIRGKAVAFANPSSLVAMYGQQWLRQKDLEAGKDYELRAARTDMGVGRMLLSADAVAAVMSNGEFRALPAEESSRLKIVEVVARIPNFVLMAHPRLGAERTAKLKSQLLMFLADKDDGAAFAKATGVSGIVDADEALMRELDPFVAQTRRVMSPGN